MINIKQLRYKSIIGFYSALSLHKLFVFLKYRIYSDKHYIKKSYKAVFGRLPNLKQPNTYTEKIQWYKLNFKLPLIEKCSDKYQVREYVSKTIGGEYLIPLLFHTEDYNQITAENLPDIPFIIKANHTAGTNHIVRDKNKVDWRKIQIDCHWWLHLNYSHFQKEWQYNKIKPKIVVEKLLFDKEGNIPSDYKLHYFNGNFEFLQLDIDRATAHKRLYFDKNWTLLPFTLRKNKKDYAEYDINIKVDKPKCLELMLKLGKALANPFPYVRVDFYYVNDQIYFGELTFHHGGGLEYFTPGKWDEYYGAKIPLIKNT